MLLTAQSNFYQYRIINPIGGAKTTGNTGFVHTAGLTASYSSITWSLSGTLATCTVQVDYSNDGSTVAGQLITARTCTSSGTFTAASTSTPSYVRVSYVIGSGGGTLSFTAYGCNNSTCTSGGATVTPGGPDKSIQFDDGGTFGGALGFTWDKTTGQLNLGNDTTVNNRFSIKPSLNTDAETIERALFVQTDSFGASGAGSIGMQGIEISSNHGGSGALGSSWGLEIADFANYGGGTVNNSLGIGIGNQGDVGVTDSTGISIDPQVGHGATSIGLHVASVSGATLNYGLLIEDQGIGANLFGIKVNGGQNDLGPQQTIVGNLKDSALSPSLSVCTDSGGILSTSGCSSGTITGTGTANKVTKFTGTSAIGDSSQTDDGTHAVTFPNGTGLQTAGGLTIDRVNDTSTGTGANLFVCKSATAGSVVTCATSTKTGVQGVAIAGVGTAPGTSGSTSMCITGNCSVITDNTTVIGHYGIPSTTTIGRIHDTGAVTPTANTDSFLITSVGTAGTAVGVELSTPDWFTAQAAAKVYIAQVNTVTLTAGDTVNLNSTTPAAGANTVNIPFATSKSGTTDSVAVNAATTGTGSTFALSASPALTGTPTAPTPAASSNTTTLATTAYVTNAIAQGNPAIAVLAASTANITGTYTSVGSGIGDLFTVTATGAFTLDGIAINTIGQRILLKDQTDATQNGVYTATVVGITAVSPVFTRALDYDQPSDINYTAAIQVQSGTVNALTAWLLTVQITSIGPAGSNISYSKFSSSPSVVVTSVTGTSPVASSGGTTPAISINTNGITATQLAAQYSKGQCEIVWGGTGTSNALTTGDDAVAKQSCFNKLGVTKTITAVYCRSDIASNTTTVNPTFGTSGTGTTILSGALTCGSSGAYSSTGTVSNGALTDGSSINPVMGGTLTGTSIHVLFVYTY